MRFKKYRHWKHRDAIIKVPVNRNGEPVPDNRGFVHITGNTVMGMESISIERLEEHYEEVKR